MTTPGAPAKRKPILLATGNRDKQQAFRELLDGLPVDPVTPQEAGVATGPDGVPDEQGETHEEIARDKALQWAQASNMLSIASDGGLVIPVLGAMWESRYTHRFAGPAADDAERLERLLELMAPYNGADREASWVEALAIADGSGVLASWELGGATGIIDERLESKGPVPEFWAFSIWRFPQFGKTYLQLSAEERASLNDHWTRLRQLVRGYFFQQYFP